MYLTEGFYWDYDDEARAWSRRYFDKMGRMPTMAQAGVYSAVLHYLKSVETAGTDKTAAVNKQMREMPVNDPVIRNGKIRKDGRLVHDMLLVQVKKPSESKEPLDYYNIETVLPGDEVFRPLEESVCPLVKN